MTLQIGNGVHILNTAFQSQCLYYQLYYHYHYHYHYYYYQIYYHLFSSMAINYYLVTFHPPCIYMNNMDQ